MDMRIQPLQTKILLESNPPKSRILVRRSAVPTKPVPIQDLRPKQIDKADA